VALQQLTGADEFADAALATWRDVWMTLSPIIGVAGVAALFQRSVFLRVAQYPWLAKVSESTQHDEFDTLRRELSQQTMADAVAANDALLQSLAQVLGSLVGGSLTKRLLQPVWEKHGHTTQDSSTQ
jgi:hypothetical protein